MKVVRCGGLWANLCAGYSINVLHFGGNEILISSGIICRDIMRPVDDRK